MSAKPKEKQVTRRDTLTPQERGALVAQQILRVSEDICPLRVKAHHLWENRFRVNVFTGNDPVSAVITRSYFVVTDDEGVIKHCIPKIG